ncbi:HNH endonuclease [Ktedonobacter robiniae]|uniref:HNH nuclease domain-containing protein n=1 Tax=Ktedonobacter robiniae TaxID=2778365 RepID=A0ABQ3UIZ4_9CHLR|nr:HNH endonuclease signature motif containing protein [Ktedonobacter robiniae]GHO52377.1 hypothetical protein KSB_08520 [Ktedonobacter robiniae]
MARQPISDSLKRQVLTEAGYRCAVPTCRGILALDLHHIVEVQEDGKNTLSNLIALCPTCHALYTRGTISKDAIYAYKATLVSLSAAFDREAVDNLLFLGISSPRRNLIVSGDGVLKFSSLIAAGYADYQQLANNASLIVTYTLGLTPKGAVLLNAWRSGDRSSLANIIGSEASE